jgi:hypothetical protein
MAVTTLIEVMILATAAMKMTPLRIAMHEDTAATVLSHDDEYGGD